MAFLAETKQLFDAHPEYVVFYYFFFFTTDSQFWFFFFSTTLLQVDSLQPGFASFLGVPGLKVFLLLFC